MRAASLQADAVAQKPGKPVPRLDGRAGDVRTFLIDCTQLLREHELLVRVEQAETANGDLVRIAGARTRGGIAVELQLAVSSTAAPVKYEDLALALVAKTTLGHVQVVAIARIHE